MKTSTLRTFVSVHTWVGLVAGMALFIAFYAGAITVFEHELAQWQRSDRQDAAPQPPERAQALIDAVLAKYPQAAEDFTVVLSGHHGPEPALYWYEKRKEGGKYRHRFMLSEQGQLRDGPSRSGFVDFIYDLHFTAGLPRTFGIYVFGLVCVLYGLALVSGVVIYAPGFFKDLFALRWGRNLKRLWQDAHNVIGMLSLPFHVLFAWSGAILTIGVLLLAPFQFLVFENRLMKVLEADFDVLPHVEAANVRQATLPMSDIVTRAQTALPGMSAEVVSYHDAGDANARITVFGEIHQRRVTHMGAVGLDGQGQVLRLMPPEQFTPGVAFLRGLQSLHYGNFGAATVQWLYFVLGLAGAFLFYSGNLLWIEARRKRRSVAQPRRTRFVAGLTIGVCIGCMAGVSAMLVANKLLPAALAQRELWEVRSYYAVFFLSMAWAFLRAPARAAHELLMLCAVLTAAVPVVNAWATENPLWLTALRGQWAIFGVDATALALAFVFWRMAAATLRRARSGDPHSLWALNRSGTPEPVDDVDPAVGAQPARVAGAPSVPR